MAAADVLDKRVPGTNDSCAGELFEPAHRSQSGLQPSVISFNRIISVLLGNMTGRRHQLIEHPHVGVWVANWSYASCNLGVFVYQPVEQVATSRVELDGDAGGGSDFSGAAWCRAQCGRCWL